MATYKAVKAVAVGGHKHGVGDTFEADEQDADLTRLIAGGRVEPVAEPKPKAKPKKKS
jgi:hypothetical protein